MPAPATVLVPQLTAALVSPELEDSWGCSEQISGYLGMSSRKEESFWSFGGQWAGRTVCAKAGAESKK